MQILLALAILAGILYTRFTTDQIRKTAKLHRRAMQLLLEGVTKQRKQLNNYTEQTDVLLVEYKKLKNEIGGIRRVVALLNKDLEDKKKKKKVGRPKKK